MKFDTAKYVAECVGTYFLVLTVCCNIHTGSIGAAFSIGAVLMVMIYALGSVSGGHFNPAVTLGVHLAGRDKIEPFDIFFYMFSQILGGLAAAFTYFAMDSNAAILMAPTAHYSMMEVICLEVFYTAALVYVVLGVATTTNTQQGNGENGFFGLAIGFTVVASAITIGPISGCSLNPAVSIGNMFVARVVHGYQAYRYWSLYVFAPFGGALLGALLFFMVQGGMNERFEYTKGKALPKEQTPPVSESDEEIPPPPPVVVKPRQLTRQGSIAVDTNETIVVPDDIVNAQLMCGVKWCLDLKAGQETSVDMDLTCVKFNKNGDCQGGIYFAKKEDPTNGIKHSGDAIMGAESDDCEFVTLKLADIKQSVHVLLFVVTIYSSEACFGDLSDYHVRLVSSGPNQAVGEEFCRHEGKNMLKGANALMSAMLFRRGDQWMFKALDECQTVPPHSSYRRLDFTNLLKNAGITNANPDSARSGGASTGRSLVGSTRGR